VLGLVRDEHRMMVGALAQSVNSPDPQRKHVHSQGQDPKGAITWSFATAIRDSTFGMVFRERLAKSLILTAPRPEFVQAVQAILLVTKATKAPLTEEKPVAI